MANSGIDEARVNALDARLTVASFLVALVAWCVLSLVHDPGKIAKSENRFLAATPHYDAGHGGMSSYLAQLDAYLADRVRLRDALITLHARVTVGVFGASPSAKLIIGKEGWFYFNDPVALAQYRGLAQLEFERLETWRRVLEGRRDWLAERGIPFVVVLVPNKHQIYPEFMPEHLLRVSRDEQHAQLAHHLAQHSDLAVVDLMPTLQAAKAQQRVYHRTDTHWNDVGAYTGYRAILAAVAEALPRYADVLEPVKVKAERYLDRGIGLTSMVGLSHYYREEVLALRKVAPHSQILMENKQQYARLEREQLPLAHGVPGAQLPRAVVFRDSFSNALIPYLSENFRRVLYVWSRDVEPRIVEREQPDIVIQQIAGRLLDRTPVAIGDSVSGSGRLDSPKAPLTTE
ncbi:MAG: hypothetical protein GY733_23130 [bacterium]|nr:hypothetical protein [bacterium]